jgi:DNA-directed RNA polymerase subunit F
LKYPLRNIIYEKIQQLNNVTDSELTSILSKEGIELDSAELNKILLDLEIYGLLKVSWISKDKRRIELLR